MNQFHEMLLKRHSIRKYTDQEIDPESVKMILEAGLLAPSSKNGRPWHFVVVDDREMLEKMSTCKPSYATSIAVARFAVVVTVDPEKSEAYLEDAAIAAQFMQLQAEALGLGSCWVQVRGRENAEGEPSENVIRDLLGIPYSMIVECVVTFGYKNEERRPVDPAKLRWEKVSVGSWSVKE